MGGMVVIEPNLENRNSNFRFENQKTSSVVLWSFFVVLWFLFVVLFPKPTEAQM